MKIVSAVSTAADSLAAAEELLQAAAGPADLALLFLTRHHAAQAEAVAARIRESTGAARLIGCTAGAVIGGGKEIEGQAAISLMLLRLPGVDLNTLHLTQEDLVAAESPEDWHQRLGADNGEEPVILLLPDPYSVDSMALVESLNDAYPGLPLVGGLASGAQAPGENLVLVDGEVHREGAAAAVLSGDVRLLTVVSQGCRPIGKHLVITKAQGNVVQALGGRPALAVVRELLDELPEDEQELARQALLVGRVINENQPGFGRGDFLIRNILGVDPDSGALAVGDRVRTGQTIQFHVRDGAAAREDLEALLADAAPRFEDERPGGALLFTCMGRGTGMYGEPDHDVNAVRKQLKDLPVGGFFCNGEIGPVGGRNFIHGFTASIGFLLPR